ncbi:unnamed protein product [Victoria cruziana]
MVSIPCRCDRSFYGTEPEA